MLEAFVWGSGGRKLSPAEAAREKEIAEALLAGAIDTSPVGHWLQGAARMGQALSGKIREGRANKASDEGRSAYTAKFNEALGGTSDPVASVASSLVAPSSPSPAPSPSSATPSVNISGSKQEFVNALLPAAIEESKRTGVDPRIIVAQAAQETGWGRAAPGNNYFGIKSHGKGGGQNLKTHEYVNGKRVNITDSFRKFESPADSVRGYGDFILTNPRYKPFREAQGLDAQLEALQASGYATDPRYSQSVGAIARGIQLPTEVAPQPAPQPIPQPQAMQAPGLADEAFNARFDMGMPAPEMIDGSALPQAQAYAAERGGLSMPATPVLSSGLDMMTGQPAMVDPVQSVAASLTNSPVNPELPMAGNTSGFMPVQQAQAPSGPSMQKLIELASDPWANDAQRGIAQALLSQQMQQQEQARDPMRQLQLQKAQLELEAMRNPQPQMTDTQRNLQYRAQEAGLVPGSPEYINFMLTGGTQPAQTNITNVVGGEQLTPGQKKIDENFADTYLGWISGGYADSSKQLSQLEEALTVIGDAKQKGKNISGAVGLLPAQMQPFVNSEGTIAKEAVEEVVQRSLREILGAQFTEKEGERLIARAYNPLLPPQENEKRVRRLLGQVKGMAEAKQDMATYFEENGTLRGYKGRAPSFSSIDALEKEWARSDKKTDTGIPAGVDPEDWKHMTEEERALFR